ncbi:hypothetical protein ACFSQT_29670 [Mesorhizobium calcicola]|uniref:Uncharacterized protein n=1 Tax=Mesorhizobium calcicola TaxID=1300310 RepID=A0ABW4WMG3_9HYPH
MLVDAAPCRLVQARAEILQTPTDMDFGRTFVVARSRQPSPARLLACPMGNQANGDTEMSAYWIAVASAEHAPCAWPVRAASCRSITAGRHRCRPRQTRRRHRLLFANHHFRRKDGLQALRRSHRAGRRSYQGDMGGGFTPFRRDVELDKGRGNIDQAAARQLDFTAGKFELGLSASLLASIEISAHDFR